MRTNSPSENIPNFDNCYDVLKDYIKEHQGEKGYINTDPIHDELYLDTIYGIVFSEISNIGMEEIVFGIRLRDNDIEVLMRPWMRTYHNAPTEKEIADDSNWQSLRWSDVYFVPTLINICENIEGYC